LSLTVKEKELPKEMDVGAEDTMELAGITPDATVDVLGSHGEEQVLLMLVRNALDRLQLGQVLEVVVRDDYSSEDLEVWCRLTGNQFITRMDGGDHLILLLSKGSKVTRQAVPDWGVRLPRTSGGAIVLRDWFSGRVGDVPEDAPTYYGFMPRGAVPEPGTPDYPYVLNRKSDVWADNVADLYEIATSQQWNAATDIPWDQLEPLPDGIERAVCQVMTFLVENEYAAMYIPAKFLPRINSQYTEVVLFLSTMINDEARHIEAFTKRALANGGGLQYSAASTQRSLQSLLVQEDYFRSSFLLHVLGEGTFLELLAFVERHAPDPVTAEVVRRARNDEGRHVAYGVAHAREHLRKHPTKVEDLVEAVEERSSVLQATTGANPMLIEALAVLAGSGDGPDQVARGMESVRRLYQTMYDQRVQRMVQIGLDTETAKRISQLHTPNFM